MARLVGPILLDGRIGNLCFYQDKNGSTIVRRPGGPRQGEVTNSPNYERTRENNSEFGRSQKNANLISRAFAAAIGQARDSRALRRLHSVALQIVKTDTTNIRGQRTISAGQLDLFEGFDFNSRQPLTATIKLPFLPSIDRASGNMDIVLPAFIPSARVAQAPGATHFRLTAAGGALDFEAGTFETDTAASVPIAVDSLAPVSPVLSLGITAGTPLPLFLLLGITYYETLPDGGISMLRNKTFNALSVVRLDHQA